MQVAKLSADLYANTSRFESGMKKASGVLGAFSSNLDRSLGRNTRSFDTFNSRISRTNRTIGILRSELGQFAAAAAGALSVNKVIQYSDTFKELEGRLKVATDGVGDLVKIQKDLFEISQKNSAPLRDVIDAYSRLSLALDDTQKKSTDLTQVTDLLSKTLLVSGTNAAGSATFFQQFGQAASGNFKAVGAEIQTFQDQNAFFIKVLQENLDTGGRSIKDFAADGDLSFDLIAKALIDGSDRINTAVEGIPDTVGKALQRLDNAFLKLIGQSDLTNQGVSSLAFGISTLADNLDIVAKVAGGVALIFAGRLLGSLGATATAYGANVLQATAYQAALARMAGVSGVAASAQLGLATAMRAVSASMALVGGPLGVAFIATMGLMALQSRSAGEAQREMNERLNQHRGAVNEFISASQERRKEIEAATRQNIENLKAELKAVDILFKAYAEKSFVGRVFQNLGSRLGIGEGVQDIVSQGAALEGAIKELEKDLKTFQNFEGGKISGLGDGRSDKDGKKADNFKKVVENLRQESEELRLQRELYGQKESVVNSALRLSEIENQLKRDGIVLTEEQKTQLRDYVNQVENQKDALSDVENQTDKLSDAYRELGGTFSSAFEDAIVEGQKFGDVLQGLAQDIQRILVRKTITEPLTSGIADFAGDIFSGFSFGSFATGIQNVPYDMTARLHKGEAVIPAQQASKLQNGGNDGYVINIDARGADAGVEQKIRNVMNEVMTLRKEVPSIAVSSVSNANKRNPRYLNG